MPRDSIDEALAWPGRLWQRVKASIRSPLAATAERRGLGLSAKLLLLTITFVMLAEVLIFVPSVANFRITWLTDRLTAAQLAALAAEAVPGGVVPDALRTELLRTAQVRAVALKRNNERRLVLPPDSASQIDETFDFRASARAGGVWQRARPAPAADLGCAQRVLGAAKGRIIRVIGEPGMGAGDFIEVVLPEAPLKSGHDPLWPQRAGPVGDHLGDHRGARLFRAQRPAGAADDAHRPQHAALQPEPGGRQPHHRALAAPGRDRHRRARARPHAGAS